VRRRITAHALACLLLPAIAVAQPAITAQRVEQPPTLDGDVASDPVWKQVTPVTSFVQEQPDEGQPSTERSVRCR
jgi:hypothetical protein